MLCRNWLIILALGGYLAHCISATSATAEEKIGRPDLESSSDDQRRETLSENLTPALNQIEDAIRDLVTQQRAANEKGPSDHETSDLEAQWAMVHWAKLMLFATAVATLLTLIGIFLIWRTLHHTRRAADYTEGMLAEAKETTREAKRQASAAITQARADVGISITNTRIVNDIPSIHYTAKNTGHTSAYSFSIGMELVLLMNGEERSAVECTKYPAPSIENIGPQCEVDGQCTAVKWPNDMEADLVFASCVPKVIVRYNYISAFGETVTGRDVFLGAPLELISLPESHRFGSVDFRRIHTEGTRGSV